MNLQSILATNFLAVTALIILLITSNLAHQLHQPVDKLFTAMVLVTMSACTAEAVSFVIDGVNAPYLHLLNMICASYTYLCNMALSVMWCIYVDLRLYRNKHYVRKNVLALAAPAIFGTVLVLLNVPFGFFFVIDEHNVYHRKPLAVALLIITLYYVFYSIRLRYTHYKNEGKSHFFPIYMFLAPVITGAIVQTLWYGISIDWCSVSLGLVGIHISLQNELSYIDPLTRLLNRNFLNNLMADWHNRKVDACGIMLDVDKFKQINDTYGHAVGDEALVDTAMILQRAASPRAHVIRFAGDEFMILLTGGNADDMSDMIAAIRRGTREFNESTEKPYQLSFSIGGALYHEDTTMDEFFRIMDHSMYREKKAKHAARGQQPMQKESKSA